MVSNPEHTLTKEMDKMIGETVIKISEIPDITYRGMVVCAATILEATLLSIADHPELKGKHQTIVDVFERIVVQMRERLVKSELQ